MAHPSHRIFAQATTFLACSIFSFCISTQYTNALNLGALQVEQTFEIENQQLRIEFHPESGTYDVWETSGRDKAPSAQPTLSGMSFSGNQFTSSDPGYQHEGRASRIGDAFGSGRQLEITSISSTGQPTLFLRLRIYDAHNFITAGCGLENTTSEPLQLKTLTLAEGSIFPQTQAFPHLSILDGNGGANRTQVSHETPVASKNNILITFGDEYGDDSAVEYGDDSAVEYGDDSAVEYGDNNNSRSLIMGGLTYVDFQKTAVIDRPSENGPFEAMVQLHDDVGKRIDPGTSYLPEDLVYIDFLTNNPFEAAEQYARSVRKAMEVEINAYTFPSICMWFISVSHFGGDEHSINDTPGAVREMDHIVDSGFLKYSPVGVRLVPDNYEANNEQGWWDDEHWQMYGRKERCVVEGGHYKEPYETTAKWCEAITARGGIPMTYFQPGVRSEDYAEAFPEHMLFNEAHNYRLNGQGEPYVEAHAIRGGIYNIMMQESYDYTDPGFLLHMQEVYANLEEGGMRGVFYDYPTRAYPGRGGMEDEYSTASAAYRTVFQLAREPLGPVCYLQERLGWGSDIATGLVDSQRTEGDTNVLRPDIVGRAGLRWYKNRMITNYDMDGKALVAKGPSQSIPISETERRAILTMNYAVSGRLLLTETFSKMSPQVIHDLSRTIPYHDTTLTARPLDAFISENPSIFDFAITPEWHQLAIYNSESNANKTFDVQLAGNTAFGAIGLNPENSYYIYDFWNDRLTAKLEGTETLTQILQPEETRMLSIHQVEPHPQWISTNRHIMQGYVDLSDVRWTFDGNRLSGTSQVVGDDPYTVTIATNGYTPLNVELDVPNAQATIEEVDDQLVKLTITSDANVAVHWNLVFDE